MKFLLHPSLHSTCFLFFVMTPLSQCNGALSYPVFISELPGYVGYLFLGGLTTASAKLAHVGPRDKSMDGKIVECSLDPRVGWKVLRIRTDKTEPNHHKSGVGEFSGVCVCVCRCVLSFANVIHSQSARCVCGGISV